MDVGEFNAEDLSIFEEKYSNPGKVCVFTLEVSPNKPLSSQDVREKLIFDL